LNKKTTHIKYSLFQNNLMDKNSNLGRGLSSLIPPKINKDILPKDTEVVAGDEMIVKMALEKIKANPNQPRTHFDHEGMEELTNSIKEHGILQPIILTSTPEGYQVIAGERRFRAAQILELATVPCIIRDMEEQEKLEIGTIAIDSLYSPVVNVGFTIESTRVGEMTNYEKLIMLVETDGSLSIEEAVNRSTELLVEQFSELGDFINEGINQATPEVRKKCFFNHVKEVLKKHNVSQEAIEEIKDKFTY